MRPGVAKSGVRMRQTDRHLFEESNEDLHMLKEKNGTDSFGKRSLSLENVLHLNYNTEAVFR